ncbi:DUF4286 family protein [Pinibacter soli]|uniref:DUF4286 family protein n=1 Tax=Pinibacter soli TaxID=3044211 RepID=A0ABT6RJ04_9BACT|nr:DUF4286 family protein [Pinibacter soli]MDI3322550.1 DUF4286 family protein [Pinibacter soli]
MNESIGFIYNVTSMVSWPIHEAWLEWMRTVHAPEVLATECFTSFRILKLHEIDETEGPTYAVQYFAESKALYNRYITKFSEGMRQKGYDKWGDRFVSFHSVMEVVQ